MNTIVLIFFTLIFFIYNIVMLIVVTAYKDRKYGNFLKKVDASRWEIEKKISKHLDIIAKGDTLNESEVAYVKKNLTNDIFTNILDAYLSSRTNEDKLIRTYMNIFKEEIMKDIYSKSRSNDILKVYNIFRIGLYRLEGREINEYLLESLDTNSLYLKYNALRAIANIGNEQCIVDALKYLSIEKDILNHKVVLDIINNSAGDKEVQKKMLIETIYDFSADIKSIVIEYFRIQSIKEASNILLEMLNDDSEHMEVRLSIIRYFGRIYYPPVRESLEERMFHSEWEYRALCASALTLYKSSETENTLLNCIGDTNWYVRYNTANTLLDYEISDEKIIKIINSGDRYASDIMKYALTMKKRMILELDNNSLSIKSEMETIC